MNKKILAIIRDENDQYLLLHNNPADPRHGGDIWYTVTGSMEDEDHNLEDAVRREVKEETGLYVVEICNLDWVFEYSDSEHMNNVEHAFLVTVNRDEVILNNENIGYKWLNMNDYINEIFWYYDKSELKNMLEMHTMDY